MEPSVIKTKQQYEQYLVEVERLASEDPKADSADGRRLELLAMLVEDYERSSFEFAMPDPIDAILFRMEQQGLRQKDIAPFVGGQNRASEILSRKRPLTLPMIRKLHEALDIPSSLLIREPEPSYGKAHAVDDAEPPTGPGRADQKLTYARVILKELRANPDRTTNDDWEKAHQECVFFHLAGSVEGLMHEVNLGYGLGLDICDVTWAGVRKCLSCSGQESPAYDELERLRNDRKSWLSLLFEFRNHGAHRANISKVVQLSNHALLDNLFIDPRTGDAQTIIPGKGCLEVLEFLGNKVEELIRDLRELDPMLG